MYFKPRSYQAKAIAWLKDHKRCGLFLEMGLGKTVCVLQHIYDLIYDELEMQRVLVIAPIRVATLTWPDEIDKWFPELTYAVACGNPSRRVKAFESRAQIIITNRENVVWAYNKGLLRDFTMIVIDELSSFKNASSARFKALRKVIRYVPRVIGLTGTPTPNGLIDLWPQIYLLDQGKRLGRTLSSFRQTYFKPGRSNGYMIYEYIPIPDAEDLIFERLGDLCMSMKKKEYLSLPERLYVDHVIELPREAVDYYKTIEKKSILELSASTVVANNAASLTSKLQQIAQGGIYVEEGRYVEIHNAKLEALVDLIEQANGQSVLVFYAFRFDREKILKEIPEAREMKTREDLEDWNAGRVSVMIAHPASIGHGLNLQQGGHIIVWYGLTWSLELYQQANDRLYRQGQEQAVMVHRIVAKGTVDERIVRVLEGKEKTQEALMNWLSDKKREYGL